MNSGFAFNVAGTPLQASILISLLSTWVLVGLFQYLNRFTRRRYFSIWTAAWLFYALFLSVSISAGFQPTPILLMCKNWCLATAAVLMLWGSFVFLNYPAGQRLIGITLLFVTLWSYAASFHFPTEIWINLPAFLFLGFASAFNAYCFFYLRKGKVFLGAGLLTFGFALWALFLFFYPFLQAPEHLLSMAFIISGILQLFIAVSMIVLVLEEAKATVREAEAQALHERGQANFFRAQAETTEQSFQQLFENANEAILIISEKSLEILKFNESARRLLRVPSGSNVGLLDKYCAIPSDTVTLDTNTSWLQALANIAECDVTRQDGTKVRVQTRGSSVGTGEEKIYQLCLLELTQQAKLERQLRQAEKLSALGRMISGVAHELNNPLAAIKGYTDLVLLTASLEQKTRGALIKVAQESNRAAKLVTNLLAFARPESTEFTPVNVNDLVQRAVSLRASELSKKAIQIEMEVAAPKSEIFGCPEQLNQVLSNLLDNSEQAMDGQPGPKIIKLSTRLVNDKIQIRIEDRGPGIPDDVLPKIFEPFFTTKTLGDGAGLGLSLCYTIVLNHKGRIYYEPASAGGACFTVELPLSHHLVCASTPSPIKTPNFKCQAGHPAQMEILVLDDEPALRSLLKDLLELLGHHVTLVDCGRIALEKMAETNFDKIVSDFRMPEMNGEEFFNIASQLFPETKNRFIFITGDMIHNEARSFFEKTDVPCILKPFNLATLEQAICSSPAISNQVAA